MTVANVRVTGLPKGAKLDAALLPLAEKELARLKAAGEPVKPNERDHLLKALKELVNDTFKGFNTRTREDVAKNFEEMIGTYSMVLGVIPKSFKDQPALKKQMMAVAQSGITAAQKMADKVREKGTVSFHDFVAFQERTLTLAPAIEVMLGGGW